MQTFLRALESAVLLIARLGFGALMFVRGWTRLTDGSQLYTARLEAAGLPWPSVFFWGTVVLEIGGGVMLACGVLTRLVAAGFAAECVMTILWLHWWNGWSVAAGGWEYAGVMTLLMLVLVGFGGGAVAVDRLLFPHAGRAAART
jgi:putative oxidoreductase